MLFSDDVGGRLGDREPSVEPVLFEVDVDEYRLAGGPGVQAVDGQPADLVRAPARLDQQQLDRHPDGNTLAAFQLWEGCSELTEQLGGQ